MEHVTKLFEAVEARLQHLAKANAVVGTPISVGDQHILPLVELSVGVGGGGGLGKDKSQKAPGKGEGGGAGGGARATPVAVVVVEGGKARIERIG